MTRSISGSPKPTDSRNVKSLDAELREAFLADPERMALLSQGSHVYDRWVDR